MKSIITIDIPGNQHRTGDVPIRLALPVFIFIRGFNDLINDCRRAKKAILRTRFNAMDHPFGWSFYFSLDKWNQFTDLMAPSCHLMKYNFLFSK
jgi:hypothetical protein